MRAGYKLHLLHLSMNSVSDMSALHGLLIVIYTRNVIATGDYLVHVNAVAFLVKICFTFTHNLLTKVLTEFHHDESVCSVQYRIISYRFVVIWILKCSIIVPRFTGHCYGSVYPVTLFVQKSLKIFYVKQSRWNTIFTCLLWVCDVRLSVAQFYGHY